MAVEPLENLAARVGEIDWYHCIDLGGGVVTSGHFDLRPTVKTVPLPASLEGKRCLDVGTWDGFWAFEMERRGAESVTATDVDDPGNWDWPPRNRMTLRGEGGRMALEKFKSGARGFAFAREALGSSVERVDRSIYALDPDEDGRFDFIFLGSLLLHLRDPVAALAALRCVCAGEIVIADAVDVIPSILRRGTPTARLEGFDRPWWWTPNRAGLRRMVESAGFEIAEVTPVYYVPLGPSHPGAKVERPLRALLTAEGRERHIISWRKGLPHVAVRGQPMT